MGSNVIALRRMGTKSFEASRWKDLPYDQRMDLVINTMDQSGYTDRYISNKSGVSLTTLNAWRTHKTRFPLGITMEFVLNACGKTFGGVVDL